MSRRRAPIWWLGRAWHADHPTAAHTHDALVILRAGDRPDQAWLKACATALANRDNLAFAGTWRTRENSPHHLASALDLSPESYPFEQGQQSTRTLIRTTPGLLLTDLLDPVLAGLGEIGLIWNNIAAFGPGALLDQPLIHLAPLKSDELLPPDPSILKYLLAKYAHPFVHRLALYAGLMHERVGALQSQVRSLAAQANLALPDAHQSPNIDPPLEHKVRIADELGGKTLARLAFKKLTRKLGGHKPG